MSTAGFSLELESGALATCRGLPGGAACVHDGAVFLADADGLYRVGGDDDAGEPIAVRIALPPTDGGLPGPKRLVAVAVEGFWEGEIAVAAASDEGSELAGTLGPVGSREAAGRGLARLGRGRGNAWRVTLAATDGAALDIGAISLLLTPLDRRRP
ncbi:MAG: hypothetical protein ACP59X_20490 [Solidesulfovibrio sp. DCME]|uniref:hypothetical protein n=1 Tax=Solidesulfovibrio sp. DCME TaxID=3447380 RepID=UPI003D1177B0